MAAPATTQAVRLPGILYGSSSTKDPAGSDYGTALGLVRDVVVRRVARRKIVTAGERGSRVATVVRASAPDWVVLFALRGFDADARTFLFPSSVFTGATDGQVGLRESGTTGLGENVDDDALQLMYVPTNEAGTKLDATQGLIFYRALPYDAALLDLGQSQGELDVLLGDNQEATWSVAFLATEDSSGRLVEWQTLADMTDPTA